MTVDPQVLSLIAVGASVAANCQLCLERTTELALRRGAGREQIAEAIEVGQRVRHGAASKMDEFAAHQQGRTAAPGVGTDAGCGCARETSEQISKGA